MNIPNIMIIGAMKCGTTSLFDYIKDHPHICPSFVKEPEFFSSKKKDNTTYYKELFDIKSMHKYTLEGSTNYTKYPTENNIASKIIKANLNPKFIYLVRNPLKRIESHYNFMQHHADWDYSITSEHVINTSNYYLQLEQFLKHFNKEDFLVLDFDDLKSKPKQTVEKVLIFLKLDTQYIPESFTISNKTYYKNKTLVRVKNRINILYQFIPKSFRQKLIQFLSTYSSKNKQQLSEDEKRQIHQILEKDMIKLHKEFGVNIEKWGFTLPVHKSLE